MLRARGVNPRVLGYYKEKERLMTEKKPLYVRDVPEDTIRLYKIYAAQYGLTMAEAMTEIIRKVMQVK